MHMPVRRRGGGGALGATAPPFWMWWGFFGCFFLLARACYIGWWCTKTFEAGGGPCVKSAPPFSKSFFNTGPSIDCYWLIIRIRIHILPDVASRLSSTSCSWNATESYNSSDSSPLFTVTFVRWSSEKFNDFISVASSIVELFPQISQVTSLLACFMNCNLNSWN